MAPEPEDEINEKNPRPLDEDDIALLKTYVSPFLSSSSRSPLSSFCNLIFDPSFSPLSPGPRSYFFLSVSFSRSSAGLGPYSTSIKKVEKEIKELAKKVNDLCGMFVN
ncbi:hypothetical protein GW17_00008196 [Ensete ventricosum]|nr:hypothetical protein GW17_00008196 [Ensete ventricosum]